MAATHGSWPDPRRSVCASYACARGEAFRDPATLDQREPVPFTAGCHASRPLGLLRSDDASSSNVRVATHEVGPRQVAQVDGAFGRLGSVDAAAPGDGRGPCRVARADEADGEEVAQRAVVGVSARPASAQRRRPRPYPAVSRGRVTRPRASSASVVARAASRRCADRASASANPSLRTAPQRSGHLHGPAGCRARTMVLAMTSGGTHEPERGQTSSATTSDGQVGGRPGEDVRAARRRRAGTGRHHHRVAAEREQPRPRSRCGRPRSSQSGPAPQHDLEDAHDRDASHRRVPELVRPAAPMTRTG